jgi:cysteine synthase/rhodanese-related sulfurtransferase
MIVERMTDLIGNTPMLKIPESVHGLKNVDLYAKLEMMNPFGSVKDRTAWGMIKDDINDIVREKKTVFENSSGNTAKALQAIGASHGIQVKLVTGLSRVETQKDVILFMGSDIEEFAAANDCFDPSDPNDPQFLIQKAVQEQPGKIYFPSQFTNEKNPDIHYETTGAEILADLGRVDYFYGGLGTTGSSLGIARRLRAENPDLVSVGVTSEKNHFIPGIRSLDQMWESGLFEKKNYEEMITLKEKPCIEAMLELSRKLGLLCGPSSAANYLGAVTHLKKIDASLASRKTAVFLVGDRAEWYMDYVRERMPEVFKERPRPNSFASFEFSDADPAPQIAGAEVEKWITENDPLVIDIRSHIAFRLHHLKGAINIPQVTFEGLIDGADPFPKDRKILLACAVGEKTRRHAAYLQRRGYDVMSVAEGMRGLIMMPHLLAA